MFACSTWVSATFALNTLSLICRLYALMHPCAILPYLCIFLMGSSPLRFQIKWAFVLFFFLSFLTITFSLPPLSFSLRIPFTAFPLFQSSSPPSLFSSPHPPPFFLVFLPSRSFLLFDSFQTQTKSTTLYIHNPTPPATHYVLPCTPLSLQSTVMLSTRNRSHRQTTGAPESSDLDQEPISTSSTSSTSSLDQSETPSTQYNPIVTLTDAISHSSSLFFFNGSYTEILGDMYSPCLDPPKELKRTTGPLTCRWTSLNQWTANRTVISLVQKQDYQNVNAHLDPQMAIYKVILGSLQTDPRLPSLHDVSSVKAALRCVKQELDELLAKIPHSEVHLTCHFLFYEDRTLKDGTQVTVEVLITTEYYQAPRQTGETIWNRRVSLITTTGPWYEVIGSKTKHNFTEFYPLASDLPGYPLQPQDPPTESSSALQRPLILSEAFISPRIATTKGHVMMDECQSFQDSAEGGDPVNDSETKSTDGAGPHSKSITTNINMDTETDLNINTDTKTDLDIITDTETNLDINTDTETGLNMKMETETNLNINTDTETDPNIATSNKVGTPLSIGAGRKRCRRPQSDTNSADDSQQPGLSPRPAKTNKPKPAKKAKISSSKKFRCTEPDCSAAPYASQDSLNNHCISAHSDKVFECRFCDKEFRRYGDRSRHENEKHLGKKWKCKGCGLVSLRRPKEEERTGCKRLYIKKQDRRKEPSAERRAGSEEEGRHFFKIDFS